MVNFLIGAGFVFLVFVAFLLYDRYQTRKSVQR